MQATNSEVGKQIRRLNRGAVLELTVNNHPGMMSHICGLFSRRAYHLKGILCMPFRDGEACTIWLLLDEDHRFSQIIKQVQKLQDVLEVKRQGANRAAFSQLEELFGAAGRDYR